MEKDLLRMIGEINKKRCALEEECDMLSELLRPWPQQKSGASNSGSENSSSSKIEPNKKEDDLSREEQEALLTVEKLLQKAQITRQVKAKHKLQVEKLSHSTLRDKFDAHKQSTQEQLVEIGDSHDAKTYILDTPPLSGRSLTGLSNDDSNFNHIQAETQRNSRRGVIIKRNMGAACVQPSQTLDKNTSTKNKNLSRPQQPNSHSQRTSRPASGKNQYVPVHMSAPFKTENFKMPSRRTNQAHSLSRHSSLRPRPDSGLSRRSYKALPAIKHSGNEKGCHRDNSKFEEEVNQSGEDAILFVKEDRQKTEVSNLDAADGPTSSPTHSHGLQSQSGGTGMLIRDDEKKIHSLSESNETEIESRVELFTLKRNGSDLKIPGKLVKLVNINNSLHEQCSAARLIKRVSPSDSGQQFVERLQGEWNIGEELWTRVRATTCLRAHRRLLEMLHGLNLSQITAQSSYGTLYRAKRTLEFVLSMFASLQEESDYLSQVQFRNVDSPSVEYRPNHKCDLLTVAFSDHHAGYENKDVEQYLKGSKEWACLKFTESYLNLQMQLLDLIRSEWWQTLSADTRDPSVLQTLYSLLCSGGQFLPAFVTN